MPFHCLRTGLFAIVAGVAATPASALPRVIAAPAAHDYLLGRYADADNRPGDAARYYDAALKAAPGDPVLQRRAFDTALAAGDERLAMMLARDLNAAQAGDAATALVSLADALRRRDWAAADTVKGLPDTGYAAVVGPIVGGWVLFGRGDVDGALALVDPANFNGIARSYVTEHRALILSAARRYAAADPLFAAMLADEARSVDRLRISAAFNLAAQRKTAEAAALLTAGGHDAALDAAAKRIAAGKSALALEPRGGVAVLALRLAGDLSRERPVPLAARVMVP